METKYKLAVAVALSASALFSTSALAAAVTCPNPLTPPNNNTYTVDPALDCVWGNGNINGGTNDAFLDGLGTNDGGGSSTFGLTWTTVGTNENPGDAIAGITFTNLTNTSANWTLTNSAFGSYALGVKDGSAPQWAVFLLDGTSGTVSMTGGSFSHFSLYGAGTPTVSEPGVLGLLGLSLVMLGFLRRRKQIA